MSGSPVDILSGMPLDWSFGERKVQPDEGANNLIESMRLVGVSRSEAYQVVVQKVMEVLDSRISNILSSDPQAKVCLDILRAVSAPEITAKEAARRYVRRYSHITPALGDETTPEKEEYP